MADEARLLLRISRGGLGHSAPASPGSRRYPEVVQAGPHNPVLRVTRSGSRLGADGLTRKAYIRTTCSLCGPLNSSWSDYRPTRRSLAITRTRPRVARWP